MKKTITAITLAMVLMAGTTFANGGLIVSDFAGGGTQNNNCKEDTVKVDNGILVAGLGEGILVAGFTGILVAGFTGILVAGAVDTEPTTSCGILVAG